MTTTSDHDPLKDREQDREIEHAVLAYLTRHPGAADTLEGIARWWLPRQRYSTALARIESALRRMVADGRVRERVLPNGDALYARGETTMGGAAAAAAGTDTKED